MGGRSCFYTQICKFLACLTSTNASLDLDNVASDGMVSLPSSPGIIELLIFNSQHVKNLNWLLTIRGLEPVSGEQRCFHESGQMTCEPKIHEQLLVNELQTCDALPYAFLPDILSNISG